MKAEHKKLRQLFFLSFVLMILLCGCANISDGSENQRSQTKQTVAMITKSTSSAFWKSVEAGANAACTEYNMNLIFEGPDNEEDYETQNKMIEEAVKEGAKAIVFSAVDYEANAQSIDKAAEQGVKIVVIDSDVNSANVSCRISTDNYVAGQMAGEAMLDTSKNELNIGIVNFDKNSENGQQREKGFKDVAQADPRVNIVETINVISTTKDATMDLLKRHPEINCIATFNEWTSLGVGYAIQDLELANETRVVAFDSNVVSVGMLETGEVDALIVQNPYAMGYLGIEAVSKLLAGETVSEPVVDTATTLITRENMFTESAQRILFTFQ
ncbi:MAG: substrate-binding domain-containing protein [Lachnospiraceae bacterium]|nr:substrate-binding domain-containing protein [Lachnospiraceae bacterium]